MSLPLLTVVSLFVAALPPPVHGQAKLDVNWEDFLSRADLVWAWNVKNGKSSSSTPYKWYHSAFLGNGALGMMIHCDPNNMTKTLYFSVSSSAVWDDRQPGKNYTLNNFVVDRPRLPSGHFLLHLGGQVQNATMRLDLWNAEARGNLKTTAGTISFRAFANAVYNASDSMVVELNATDGEATGAKWEWVPELADSTWGNRVKGYVHNPPPEQSVQDGINVTTQKHLSGNTHALAFQIVSEKSNSPNMSHSVLHISISPVVPDGASVAVANVKKSVAQGVDGLVSMHRQWWHQYYPASFLTFNDTKIESFYWIQMYKLASGTRSDRIVYDLMGPWFIDGTGWPDLHWDLNVQLTYYPLYAANRLSLAESLNKLLDANIKNLINNVPEANRNDSAAAPSGASSLECMETCYWNYGADCLTTPPTIVGNLLWTCQLYWLHYRHSMDQSVAKGLYPILSRAVNYYTHFQIDNSSDHVVHLPTTFSPEYPGKKGPDTNYDVALYRWGLQTVIHLAKDILNNNDPRVSVWQDVLNRLTSYPVDQNGFMIADGVSFNISHRHFSHLFMIWPLNLIDWNNDTEVALAKHSVDHWIGLKGGLTGFCRPAVSVMSSLLGRPNSAFTNVTYLLDGYILPNTFYHEGENGECGETPPMAASAIQDMMLLSDRGEIWVFPGLDDSSLSDVAFYRLRAQGAFLVSSKRVSGKTAWITIESDMGEPCLLRTDMKAPYTVQPDSIQHQIMPNGTIQFDLKANQAVSIWSGSASPDFDIKPAKGNEEYFNFWGLKSH
ncbi:uncharacterized protein [Oscarella lobularis]|uniref:uncharacterized protein n=1 Tax=Oscarella lobularis TaxID=121494 RepID=UPI0033134F21